jgi:hypothetical protein
VSAIYAIQTILLQVGTIILQILRDPASGTLCALVAIILSLMTYKQSTRSKEYVHMEKALRVSNRFLYHSKLSSSSFVLKLRRFLKMINLFLITQVFFSTEKEKSKKEKIQLV